MIQQWTAAVLILLVAVASSATPRVQPSPGGAREDAAVREYFIALEAGDTDDSPPIQVPTGRSCSATFVSGGSGTVEVRQVPTGETAASSGTLMASFSATSTTATTFVPGQSFLKARATTAAPGSELRIACSNVHGSTGSGGGGAVEVASWAEVEAAMRASDLPVPAASDVATKSVALVVAFAPDFAVEPDSSTSHVINLPTGGGSYPTVVIDLGGHHITAAAAETLVLNFGRTDGAGSPVTCAPAANPTWVQGFYAFTPCMGVGHDYDITIRNGSIGTRYTGCDGLADAASCARAGLVTQDADRLFIDFLEGQPYGGRVHLGPNLAIGADPDHAPGLTYPTFSRRDDSCFVGEVTLTNVDIAAGQQWNCETAVRIVAPPAGVTTTQTQGHIAFGEGFRWTQEGLLQATDCNRCQAGLLRMDVPSPAASFTGHGLRLTGPIGNVRGGRFDLSGTIAFSGVGGGCHLPTQGSESYLLDSGITAFETLSGRINLTGNFCSRGWVRSERVTNLRIDAQLEGPLPGFLATDTEITAAGTTRIPVHDASADAVIESAIYSFQLDASPTISDITYSQLLDTNINSGAALDTATSLALVDLGMAGFYQVVGSTPTVYTSKRNPFERAHHDIVGLVTGTTFAASGAWPTAGQCLASDGGAAAGCGAAGRAALHIDNTAEDHYLESLVCDLTSSTFNASGSALTIKAGWSVGAVVPTQLGTGVTFTTDSTFASTESDSTPVALPVGAGRLRLVVSAVTEAGGADFGTSCTAVVTRR